MRSSHDVMSKSIDVPEVLSISDLEPYESYVVLV